MKQISERVEHFQSNKEMLVTSICNFKQLFLTGSFSWSLSLYQTAKSLTDGEMDFR